MLNSIGWYGSEHDTLCCRPLYKEAIYVFAHWCSTRSEIYRYNHFAQEIVRERIKYCGDLITSNVGPQRNISSLQSCCSEWHHLHLINEKPRAWYWSFDTAYCLLSTWQLVRPVFHHFWCDMHHSRGNNGLSIDALYFYDCSVAGGIRRGIDYRKRTSRSWNSEMDSRYLRLYHGLQYNYHNRCRLRRGK